MDLLITDRRALTPEIAEFTLADPAGAVLPAAQAGAHVTLRTPGGAMRRYSLTHPDPAPTRYVIAVKREADGRGGSAAMHAQAQVGDTLMVEPPQTDFALGAGHDALLIAGGIGITPILSMARQLVAEGRRFRAVYCTRDAAATAYGAEMRALCGDALILHHDDGAPDRLFDFWDLLETPTAEHVYCCGPAALMEEVMGVTGHWPEGRVHFEDFKPVEVVRADDVAFDVTLARSGGQVAVPADLSILEALRAAGHRVPSSCESGTCGTCKCGYVDGAVDHRDMVLMPHEKADKIMICVSRAQGAHLVLDL